MMRLGGSVGPALLRLGAGRAVTPDVFQLPSGARLRVPNEILLETREAEPPGGIVSRMARKSVVISRANTSMNPDPCMATVLRPLAMLCSVTRLPPSSLAPLVVTVSIWSKVEKSNRCPKTKTSVPNSPPPPTTGLLWHPEQEFMSGPETRLKLRGNVSRLLGSERPTPVPLVSGRPPPSWLLQFATNNHSPNFKTLLIVAANS